MAYMNAVAPQHGRETYGGTPEVYGAEPGFLSGFNFQSIIPAIKRNKLAIAAITLAAIALGVIVTLLMVPQFIATSRVLVEQQTEQIIEEDSVQSPSAYADADRFLQTQLDIIRSRSLAQIVVEDEGLASNPAFFEAQGAVYPTEEDVSGLQLGPQGIAGLRTEEAIGLVQDGLEVYMPLDSRIVSISFESSDPALSARIANAVANNYIESNLARKFDSSQYAREFLAQQLGDARAKLEQSERDLNQYSRAAGLIRVPGQGQNADQETTLSITNDTLVQLNSASSVATAERVGAEKTWQSIARQPVLSVPQVVENAGMQGLLRQQSDLRAELAAERARHLEDHPSVKALVAQLEQVDARIQSLGQAIKNSVRLEYEAALEREQALDSRVEGLRNEALTEQDRGVQYNILKRIAETDRGLYNTLLTRYNELNATAGATSNNVSLIDAAEIPRLPSSPNLVLNLLVALLGGLVLAGAYVFLREQFDDVLRSPDDVENKLGVSLLGLIPKVENGNVDDQLEDPKSAVSEAYNSLVTNLRYSSPDGIPASLLVTSAQASEGKTTTAHELAKEFADLGKRTILVDADLRRPTLHRRMPAKDKELGLTAVLAGELSLEQAVHQSGTENLTYLSALPMPPDPAALLGSQKITDVFARLREDYDCLIIDAPPLLGLTDAPVLSTNAEGVIMVMDASRSKRGAVKAALRRLSLVNAKVIGAVLTKFDASASGSGYSYYGNDYYAYETSE